MHIDPQAQAYLDMLASAGEQPLKARSVEENRTSFLELAACLANHKLWAALRAARYLDQRVRFRFESILPVGKGPSLCSSTSMVVDGYLAIWTCTTLSAARLPMPLAV